MADERARQREELHKAIWNIANELRGSVDGWDFKQYVLCTMFYRFISEDLAGYLDAQEHAVGNPSFSYAALADTDVPPGIPDAIVAEKGFFIRPSALFQNVCAAANDGAGAKAFRADLNMTLEGVFQSVEASATGTEAEGAIRGLFADFDVNSPKLGNTVAQRNDKLAAIMARIRDLPLGNVAEAKIDAFGDAYEFLMTMYASSAGKSGGEFFTPQEVCELLARIATLGKNQVSKVYDPCCGSGGMLLRVAHVVGPDNVTRSFFGQDVNLTTYNLARMNMLLHGVNFSKFDIALGDTLEEPAHWDDEPFEVICSNPPYSIRWRGDDNPLAINDERFKPAGVLAPKSKADLAFTMHMLSWLAPDGCAAIVEFPGVLYRGGKEGKIRKYLVDQDKVDAVIQLPPNLFFGTTIATCVLVLRHSHAGDGILFIDATDEFVHSGNKNKLGEKNAERILSAYEARADEERFCRMVDRDEVAANGYNLSVSSYVDRTPPAEEVDIAELNARIAQIVAREQDLRQQIDAIVADLEGK